MISIARANPDPSRPQTQRKRRGTRPRRKEEDEEVDYSSRVMLATPRAASSTPEWRRMVHTYIPRNVATARSRTLSSRAYGLSWVTPLRDCPELRVALPCFPHFLNRV